MDTCWRKIPTLASGFHAWMVAHVCECMPCPSASSHSLLYEIRSSVGQAKRHTDNKHSCFIDYKVTEPEGSFFSMYCDAGRQTIACWFGSRQTQMPRVD